SDLHSFPTRRSSDLAIFLMMGGNMIVSIFADKPFAKYILFANTDLKQYADGYVMIEGMTLGFSIIVLIVYYLIFLLLSWVVFTKDRKSTRLNSSHVS